MGTMIFFIYPARVALAQVTTGTPPFGSFTGGTDVINLANLNSHLTIPVIHKAGRGSDFNYYLIYDSSVWNPSGGGWQPVSNWGWTSNQQLASGVISYFGEPITCYADGQQDFIYFAFFYADPYGVTHVFDFSNGTGNVPLHQDPYCGANYTTATATDGSGLKITASSAGPFNPINVTITDRSGIVSVPVIAGQTIGTLTKTDRNGNQITLNTNGVFNDTLGTVALTVSGTAPNPVTISYTAPSGGTATYTVKYLTYTVQTRFNCGVAEYGPTSNNLVSEIDLPDYNSSTNPNSRYAFTYEVTPNDTHSPHYVTGRLVSVTLPTGGSITYGYSGGGTGVNGISCSDGSAATLTRATPDGTWTYAQVKGTGTASTTTITDPQSNQTVVQFQGIYETQRQVYQGSSTPLQTVNTCYNNAASPCTGTAITLPISQRNTVTILPGSPSKQGEHDDFWNSVGLPTETDDYDFGAAPHGSLLKKVLVTYAPLGNITGFRQTVTVQNGGLATVSKVNYNYDETTPTSTSGIPQHVGVTGPRGNLTSVNTYKNASSFLTKRFTYYDTGTLSTATDVNTAATTYNYATGTASCYNTFATSVNEPISGLSTSATWNCTGGVQLTAVDENNQTAATAYTDPYFWRPASTTDPANAVTSFCYGMLTGGTCAVNPNQYESFLTFNSGNSTVDTLITLDGLGRTHLRQRRQAPGSNNFDTVEIDYDALGMVHRETLPYVGTAGQTSASAPATVTTYDALGRPLSIADSGGRSTTYSYTQNDAFVTAAPAPAGESTKKRQFENDELGRLTSVCEITSATGNGNCAQTISQTGYWTQYTYDPQGNVTRVAQNVQSGTPQNRTFVFDWMSRMTSETEPEIGPSGNGTAYYTYDSDSTCGTSNGDLVKRVDATGDVICSTYDQLHRDLTRTYPSGTYASVTPAKHFVYDSATLNGTSMQYAKRRLAEAYTCTGSCSTKLTDIGFSYTVRGETSDVYESTPNSGTYYHVAQTYWANGAPNQLSGNLGLPSTVTYGPDGEGRISSVSASSGQNPVSSTSYNAAGLPTAVNLGSGSGDADSYQWDPNTNRMTQYKFTVNGASLTGVLGWNANATLQTQNITDGFNSSDTQNCSYQYDDITRVTSANCGSAAAQTFSFDPFGNINKSGSPYTFNAFYSTSTNRITCIGGSGQNCTGGVIPTYDSNGNVTNDSFHNYTWDAEGHPITVDTGYPDAVGLTYDALGRMVEQQRASSYTQIAYSVGGQKLALMSGSTLQKGMVPLSGRGHAVYSSSGLLYYAHPDNLGTIRLATTPSRVMYFDTAYTPYGETYVSAGGTNLDPSYTGQTDDTAHRQDVVGGLYDFPLREYSTQGRWPSPDPLGASAACPKDPQTQNRYAYVRNNPLSYIDPLGADGQCDPGDPTCCDPSTDPFCPCDPSDPFCGPTPPAGGGGETRTADKGRCLCGCSCKDFWCILSAIISGCKEDFGPEGCKETISKTPGNTGNQCAGRTPPETFIEEWSCAGDVGCCEKKQRAYIRACEDKGPGYLGAYVQPIGGAAVGIQCCKATLKPK